MTGLTVRPVQQRLHAVVLYRIPDCIIIDDISIYPGRFIDGVPIVNKVCLVQLFRTDMVEDLQPIIKDIKVTSTALHFRGTIFKPQKKT